MLRDVELETYRAIGARPMVWLVKRGEHEIARNINRRTIRDWKRRRLAELGAPWNIVERACDRPMRQLRQLPAWKNG